MDLNIAYTCRTLSQSEKNYVQVKKEALALVYSVIKFHQYLYGRMFALITDHKPLLKILVLKLVYHPLLQPECSNKPTTQTDQHHEITLFNIGQINTLPVSACQVQRVTQNDAILSKVYLYVNMGGHM